MTMTRLVLATANEGKAREIRALLPPAFEVQTAATLGIPLPEETGETFDENARLKALAVSAHSAELVLADDSGLAVDALAGQPGVRSARYAGEPANDAANIALLLRNLHGVPDAERSARFICTLCLARTGVVLALAVGTCEGSIANQPTGDLGFGYDPVFRIPSGRTMAELAPNEKNAISHRGAALRIMIPIILRPGPVIASLSGQSR